MTPNGDYYKNSTVNHNNNNNNNDAYLYRIGLFQYM